MSATQGMGYPTALSAAQLVILMDASALQYQPLCTEKADIRGSGATTPTPKDSLAGAPTPNCGESFACMPCEQAYCTVLYCIVLY